MWKQSFLATVMFSIIMAVINYFFYDYSMNRSLISALISGIIFFILNLYLMKAKKTNSIR